MKTSLFRGRTALVTGASSGLGADFARQLAALGANLVITARREAALEALAREVRLSHPQVRVDVVALDLALPDSVERLVGRIGDLGVSVDILINNAGYGAFGPFDQIDETKEATMLELDIVTVVKATRAFASAMKARGWGRILQVASIGAFQPMPLYASYAAAKAFVLNYGLAVNRELRGTGVKCTVLSPGVTATEFLKVAEQQASLYQRSMMMSSAVVVRAGLKALASGRSSIVPGWGNKVGAFLPRLVSRDFAAAFAEKLM